MGMHQPAESPRARKRRRTLLVAGLLLGFGLAAAYGLSRVFLPASSFPNWSMATSKEAGTTTRGNEGGIVQTQVTDEDPRLTFATPYRNVRPDVRYVGDDRCADCHVEQAESYRRHPMGRTFGLVSRGRVARPGDGRAASYDPTAQNRFEALGVEFSVEPRRERIMHRAVRHDRQGGLLTDVEEEALLMLGSGTHGHSYLLNHDGYLFHSPISWYREKNTWGLSPEFEAIYPKVPPITVRCLFCHSNDAGWVEHTRNHYQAPRLHSKPIGCERCHGPGELHVAARTGQDVAGLVDDTIINPGRLAPALREAVCQQCHLRGEKRIERRGRQPFDYRPGLPLQQFWSVFVRRPERADGRKLGHVEQMYLSRCFQQSNGKMGCISCHDPHVLPAPEEKAVYFRGRCLKCHEETSCSLALAARRRKQKEDDCTACHMPAVERATIAHAPLTDHRILRRAEATKRPAAPPEKASPDESPVISFYPDRRDPQDKGVARDLGLALTEFGWEGAMPFREQFCRKALPLLETALQVWPEDVPVLEAKGYALSQQGRGSEALATFRAALALAPRREWTLVLAAEQADLLGHGEEAVAYWRRAIAVNPWMPEYHAPLARLLAQRQEWLKAVEECEAALRLNPASEQTRVLLITCCIRTGGKARARREFETLMALTRQDREVLRRWFAEQMR